MKQTYLDILSQVIRDNWDKPAITDYSVLIGDGGNDYSYGQMYQKICGLCQIFSNMGLAAGDHIALCGMNSTNWIIAYLAIAKYEGVSIIITDSLSEEQIHELVDYTEAKALIADHSILDKIKDYPDLSYDLLSLSDFTSPSGSIADMTNIVVDRKNVSFPRYNADDVAEICFTSGSTNKPKGVILSYRSITNNIYNGVEVLPKLKNKTFISVLPFSHTYGFLGGFLAHIPGAHHVYIISYFAPSLFIEALEHIKPYSIVAVPMILESLYKLCGDKIKDIAGQSVREILVGGASLSSTVENDLIKLGLPIMVGSGCTETGALMSAIWWENYRPHSAGKILTGMEARISPEGEILVRGENVMLGYYKDEEATREKIDKDGWLHTGDRGYLDEDGYLYVEGRLNQDMIVLPSGENIHPENIEVLINAIPHVVESLVLARDGKLVALVRKETLVPPEQTIAERNALLAKVNPQLPSFSQLFGIEFITDPLQRTEKQTIKRYLYQ